LYKSVPYKEKKLKMPGTGIKEGFQEREQRFTFGTFHSGKTGLPFQMFGGFPKIFH